MKKKPLICSIVIALIAVCGAVAPLLIKFCMDPFGVQEWGAFAARLGWSLFAIIVGIGLLGLIGYSIYRQTVKVGKLYRQKKYEELIVYIEKTLAEWTTAKNAEENLKFYEAVALFELKRDEEFLSKIEKIAYTLLQPTKYYFLTVYYTIGNEAEKAKEYYELFKNAANTNRYEKHRNILEVLFRLDSYENAEDRQTAVASVLQLTDSDRLKAYLSDGNASGEKA